MSDKSRAFANQTFIVPFAAIIQGRNLLAPGEIGWWRIVVAGVAFSIFLYFHGQLCSVFPIAAI